MKGVRINDQGIELIKSFEGLHDGDKTTPLYEPIRCPAGLWTLGWGNIYGLDNRRVTANHRAITLAQAEELLVRDLKRFESQLVRLVRVDLNENQWAAIVSFSYNVGSYNFKVSSLRAAINRKSWQTAANEFPKWVYAKKRKLPGLVRRRLAERELFLAAV